MRPGLLRKTGEIQRAVETQDASGAVVQSWELVTKRQMDVRPMTGREFYGAEQSIGEVSHRVRLRYDKSLNALSPKDRILVDTRVFDILSVQNIQERNREFLLLCRELV